MTGFPCIVVTYSKELDDFKQAVAKAYRQHGYRPGQCTMLVVPADSKTLKMARSVEPLDIDKLLEMEN